MLDWKTKASGVLLPADLALALEDEHLRTIFEAVTAGRTSWSRMTPTREPSTDKPARCIIYTDGGARGNPGPAAAAGVIVGHDGAVLAEVTDYLGTTTNNVAEYKALILTLRRALELGCTRVAVKMDSELVVKQIAGLYRVKDAKMVPLHAEVRRLLARFDAQSVEHVSRASNKHADKLVNAVLDARDQTLRERAQ